MSTIVESSELGLDDTDEEKFKNQRLGDLLDGQFADVSIDSVESVRETREEV